MKLIYVCSPLRGDVEKNIKDAREYCKSVIAAGDIPIAPHVSYQGMFNDEVNAEREKALAIGLNLLKHCDEIWIFGDKITEGMNGEIEAAEKIGMPIIYKI